MELQSDHAVFMLELAVGAAVLCFTDGGSEVLAESPLHCK